MKYIWLSALCLGLWQCTTELTPEHDSGRVSAINTPVMISARNTSGLDVALDSANNVYVTGSFFNTATFGDVNKTAEGLVDIFVAKYDAAGTLQWVQAFGGSGYDEGRSIEVDKNGNVYVTGDYSGYLSVGNTSVASLGSQDVFLAKFNTHGELDWIRSAGSDGGERGYGVAVDGKGDAYITGEFQGTGYFAGNALQASGEFDVFVAKYNAKGDFQWVRSGGGTQRDTGRGIAADAATGDVYVTGLFFGTATFGKVTKTAVGRADFFLTKYDSAGEFQWMESAGGEGDEAGFGVTTDGRGNVYTTGQNYGAIPEFSPTGESTTGFLAKYNASGRLLWGKTLYFGEEGADVTADSRGNAHVVTGNSKILAYSSSGLFQRPQILLNTGALSGEAIASNKNDKIYIAGYYQGTLTFGNVSKTSAGAMATFVLGGEISK